uniref:40S ribosomal protein S7 n=1 Tax=Eutreptiella gymnastica TaxID=73025 RepID=A0A7S1NQ11_9EUGL|mmetsp:Transcript_71204/g.125255  ORF Transcript_71204/g.125255 Transcript_71204/m.125255 type:complete len:197 (+) Transcript_71204:54-644(+)
MALAARKKLRKSARKDPTTLEDEVAQALYDLEVNNKNLKPSLQSLYINTAKQVEIGNNKRAVVLFFPLRFIRKFHKIQKQLVVELEKKFSGKMIVMIAQRKIARQPKSNIRTIQRSRALTNVHEAILTDIMYPVDIVGRRWRYKTDGSKQSKVFIDAREKDKVESKLEGFSTIYKKLTGKEVSFGFMTNPQLQQFL